MGFSIAFWNDVSDVSLFSPDDKKEKKSHTPNKVSNTTWPIHRQPNVIYENERKTGQTLKQSKLEAEYIFMNWIYISDNLNYLMTSIIL